ncbi:MAG: hypothetical protein QOF78_1076 [Phycisphaerales bacterium]|jgi:hypothetical protein|nr:hypothetical protein [Phycisphaerales bacterium]
MIEKSVAAAAANRRKGRWGRRFGWAIATMIALVLIAHGTWSAVARHGVRSRVAALQAAGEPILPADFATPPNGPDNGGDDLLAAGDAIDQYASANRAYDDADFGLPLRPNERKVIESALTDLAAPLAQFAAGRNKPRHDWDLDLTKSPVLMNVMMPSMKGPRELCNLLRRAALVDHENGDDAAALRRVDDILHIARFCDRHPSLIGHLVAIGCTALAAETIFDLAPDLKIGAAPGAIASADARKMIDRLLDDAESRDALRRSLRGERMSQLDAVRSILNGISMPTGPGQQVNYSSLRRYVFAPFFHHNSIDMLDRMTALVPLSDEPNLHAVKDKLPPMPTRGSKMNLLSDILMPAVERIFETHHRCASDRRLAATAIAIRWYQLDHAGHRPPTLAALVPNYLPSVPNDALLRDQPLGYLPDMPRPRLYSAGANNVDDQGSDAFIKPSSDGRAAGPGDEWRTLDRCVFLDRQPRPAPQTETDPAIEPAK